VVVVASALGAAALAGAFLAAGLVLGAAVAIVSTFFLNRHPSERWDLMRLETPACAGATA
jgi:HAMP domain-containing protein